MSIPTGEYTIPIFLSSTDYDLRDLRAELSRYLNELGYKPILSSAEGFHDSFPNLQPWESCLEVLRTCPIMILVIDSRYSKSLDWPHFPELQGRKISPTHAEYLFARFNNKRMLVFVRNEVMTHYQSYKTAMKNAENDKMLAKEILSKALPRHIEFESLEFINEVKTESPIPWIKTFADVTDIKKEIQKKMLNELAEIFLVRDKHLQTVVKAFYSLLAEASLEKREELMRNNPFIKELMDKINTQNTAIADLADQKGKLEGEIQQLSNSLLNANKDSKKTEELQLEVKRLKDTLNFVNAELTRQRLIVNSGGIYAPGFMFTPGTLAASYPWLNFLIPPGVSDMSPTYTVHSHPFEAPTSATIPDLKLQTKT